MPSGSASATSVGFAFDTDTGFYRPADNTFAIATGGGKRVEVTNTLFDVKTAAIFAGDVTLENGKALVIRRASDNASIDVLTIPAGSDALRIKIPGTTAAHVLELVGTDSLVKTTFTAAGDGLFSGALDVAGNLTLGTGFISTGTATEMRLRVNNSTFMTAFVNRDVQFEGAATFGGDITTNGNIKNFTGAAQQRISSSTGVNQGSELVLYGPAHPTRASDTEFLHNGAVWFGWDDSASLATFSGDISLSGNDITELKEIIRGGGGAGTMILSGGNTDVTGANMLMYGENHATNADDMQFRNGTTNILRWQAAANLWDFQGNAITGIGSAEMVGNIVKSVNTATLVMSGGVTTSTGSNIVLWGDGAASGANDISFRTGATSRLLWDNSANNWDFQDNNMVGVQDILRDNPTSRLAVSGGTSTALGGNFILFAESHGTQAGDISFRSGSSVELLWDNSATLWNFQGNALTGASEILRGATNDNL